MYHFTADDMQQGNPCAVCCCEPLALKPGSTTKVNINYAPWAVPIGRLHCLPQFELEQKDTCGASNGGAPDVVTPVRFDTPVNAALNGDLRGMVTDPGGGVLTFKHLTLYGPSNGMLELDPAGPFIYKPRASFTGEERFFVSAVAPNGAETKFEVLIGVGIGAATPIKETPHVSVDPATANINYQYYTGSFAVKVSPAADLCEVWRLTVKMQAIDCECVCYDRTDCYDVRLVKC